MSGTLGEDGQGQEIVGYSEVFSAITRIAASLRKIEEGTTRELGISPTQLQILVQLWEKNGRSLKELADACRCSRPTITGVVDTLERNGLVTRRMDRRDRRKVRAFLTAGGRSLRDSAPAMTERFSCCCTSLDGEQLIQLRHLELHKKQ